MSDLLSSGMQLSKSVILSAVILQVTAEIKVEAIAKGGDMVASACAHFR